MRDGILTYAVGDVHGRLDLLEPLLEGLREDARARGGGTPRLVMLGDYVDRGPDSRGVVERMIEGPAGFDTVFLKGNHDDLLVRAWRDDPRAYRAWLRQGGLATLGSYGWEPGDMPVPSRFIPETHVEFLEGLGTSFDDGTRLFVHAGVDPARCLDEQDDHTLMWIREGFLDYGGILPRLVVHGHTPVSEGPQVRSHRVGIDTWAYRSGTLTCAAFDPGDPSPRFIQSRADDGFDTGHPRIYQGDSMEIPVPGPCPSTYPTP